MIKVICGFALVCPYGNKDGSIVGALLSQQGHEIRSGTGQLASSSMVDQYRSLSFDDDLLNRARQRIKATREEHYCICFVIGFALLRKFKIFGQVRQAFMSRKVEGVVIIRQEAQSFTEFI